MKQVKFFATAFVAAGMLFLNSCNSGGEKKSETTGTDSSAVKPDSTAVKETPPVAAAPGPMSIMTVKHKVANYNKWKPSYDAHDSIRCEHVAIPCEHFQVQSLTSLLFLQLSVAKCPS